MKEINVIYGKKSLLEHYTRLNHQSLVTTKQKSVMDTLHEVKTQTYAAHTNNNVQYQTKVLTKLNSREKMVTQHRFGNRKHGNTSLEVAKNMSSFR